MNANANVPLFTSNNLSATREFYLHYLGFEVFMENDMYLGLRLPCSGLELGFMPESAEHALSSGQGLLYCFAVDDIAAEYAALQAKDAPLAGPPADMPWGDRRICMTDPNGITVYLGQRMTAGVDSSTTIG